MWSLWWCRNIRRQLPESLFWPLKSKWKLYFKANNEELTTHTRAICQTTSGLCPFIATASELSRVLCWQTGHELVKLLFSSQMIHSTVLYVLQSHFWCVGGWSEPDHYISMLWLLKRGHYNDRGIRTWERDWYTVDVCINVFSIVFGHCIHSNGRHSLAQYLNLS